MATSTIPEQVPAATGVRMLVAGPRRRLVLASALMLFLELALIRWLGANIVHLGYFSNIVLLGSFLGVGLGFLRARPGRRLPLYFPVVLTALVVLVRLVPVTVERAGSDLVYFTSLHTTGPPVWLTLPAVFLGVAVVMAGPGELVAACFPLLERLEAYRYDLLGSLAGIAGFTLLSFLRAPSVAWGAVVAVLAAVLLAPASRRPRVLLPAGLVAAVLVVLVGVLTMESLTPGVSWSPYYKVTTQAGTLLGSPRVDVSVNGIPHQSISALSPRLRSAPSYALPYLRVPRAGAGDTLVIGAGDGVDVDLALQRGATSVDAVDIDPRLLQLGEELNPDRPYDDPRVHVHVDDGRAWLERTNRTYDTVILALPDSLTLVAGSSQIRLESYLFTSEALQAVHRRLRPGGVFAMYNSYREPWLVDRYAATVAQAFGHAPCVDLVSYRGNAVIVAAIEADRQQCDTPQKGARPVRSALAAAGDNSAAPAPVSDDRPFPYLRTPSLPEQYLLALLAIILVSVVAVRLAGGRPARLRPYVDLALLGAAFLLLETRGVTRFALLFGTTWLVNALVFAGVLLGVLLAVEITRRLPRPPSRLAGYALLGVALAVTAFVPSSALLQLPVPARLVAAVLVTFAPIIAANVVFAARFAGTADPTAAFGANLLGAMVGGCLEYLALIIGYPALIGVAAVLYLGAFLLAPRGTAAASS
jgi:SAM-dependent methyltransferase